ncbi:MAG: hypothetical protein RBS19_11360 [Bacteroidales bacterium]|nr:hypothetical protein [Bacteroidales bacterium]MDY0217541.1 hypothetical protein [Bacteroidales bacterium]
MNIIQNLAKQILIFTSIILLFSCQNQENTTNQTEDSMEDIASNISITEEDSIPKMESNENLDYIPTSNITYTSISRIEKHSENDSISKVPRILMLGDSHLMGPFGEHLQRAIHNTEKFDILSISIGGAGSKTYTYKMTNNCCGYAIRESLHDEVIPPKKSLRYLEYNSVRNEDVVSKKHNGKLSKVISDLQPDIVLIALGSNVINDHQGLINIIRDNSQNCEIVWIGPMRRSGLTHRIKAIQNTVDKNNIFFVRSDDVVGHDTITTTHFYGKESRLWANTIFDRIKPLLDRIGDDKDQKLTTIEDNLSQE